MTPYELSILLDVYSGRPIQASPDAPIYAETMQRLSEREFIRSYGNDIRPMHLEWAPTEKLRVFVDHILALPEPVWGMP
ncbi:hypothetical protein SAMN05428966_10266 [Massilia sp. PDC64]|nr:hypothetical protein [Massilia sp. PDC64]SDC66332.1 hypothetical protein SAMN05428966_10266 [Massilia sp. PDC64]